MRWGQEISKGKGRRKPEEEIGEGERETKNEANNKKGKRRKGRENK